MSRVYGIETEFGLVCQPAHGTRRINADEAARYLFRPVTTANKTSSVFLRNGARLYLDVGSHPEYATPECATITDLIAHDRAGELVCTRLVARAEEMRAAGGLPAQLRLSKNNTDSHGNSYGSHENYLVGRWDDLGPQADMLAPFLVSRQLLCGAGKLVKDGAGARYALSQRAEHMWDAASSATTRARPLINTRDEPHADPRRFRRMHVIVGDSTMADPTTWLRVGSTELVLRLIEADDPAVRAGLAALALADPQAAIRDLSRDLYGRGTARLVTGETISGLDLQRRVLDLTATLELEPELGLVRDLWTRVLDALTERRLDRIDTEIDWAIKWRLLAEYAGRHGLGPADPRLFRLDLAYHDIGADGVLRRLEARGLVPRLVSAEQVAAAVEHAPATRAALRGRLVIVAQEQRREFSVDWSVFTVHDLPDGALRLPDPVAATDPRVDALVARMEREPRLASSAGYVEAVPERVEDVATWSGRPGVG